MTSFQSTLLRRLSKKGRKQNGFTLIELMIVVAIVGVLSAVGLPELTKAQDRAKVAAARAELTNAGKQCSLEIISGVAAADVDITKFALDAGSATCGADMVITTATQDEVVVTLAWEDGSSVPSGISDDTEAAGDDG